MRIRVEGTVEELSERGDELCKALSEQLMRVAPDLSDTLRKAVEARKESSLKYRALRDMKKLSRKALLDQYELMLQEIGEVLDRTVEPIRKSEDPVEDPTKVVADKDDIGYRRAKSVLKRKGYADPDFEEGGPLYGWSTNQLLSLVRK